MHTTLDQNVQFHGVCWYVSELAIINTVICQDSTCSFMFMKPMLGSWEAGK